MSTFHQGLQAYLVSQYTVSYDEAIWLKGLGVMSYFLRFKLTKLLITCSLSFPFLFKVCQVHQLWGMPPFQVEPYPPSTC